MKTKHLLSLLVVPLICLTSCSGGDWNMYNQTIGYDSPLEPWNDTETSTGKTLKSIFYENFNEIDWAQSTEVLKHGSADEAYNWMNSTIKSDFAKYSAVKIVTDAKGSDATIGTGTFTVGTTSTKVKFKIDENVDTQNEFIFKNAEDETVGAIRIDQYYNHTIKKSIVTYGSSILGAKFLIRFKNEITIGTKTFNALPIEFYANFTSK